MKKLVTGDILDVLASDPGVMQDIPAWARVHGHRVLSAEKVEGEFLIRLEVGAQ